MFRREYGEGAGGCKCREFRPPDGCFRPFASSRSRFSSFPLQLEVFKRIVFVNLTVACPLALARMDYLISKEPAVLLSFDRCSTDGVRVPQGRRFRVELVKIG
jgi:hypothetical protein